MELQTAINGERKENDLWLSGLSRKTWLYHNQIMQNYREFLILEIWGKWNDLHKSNAWNKNIEFICLITDIAVKNAYLQWQKVDSVRQHLAVSWIGKNSICNYVTHTNLTLIPLCHYITLYTPLQASPCSKMVSLFIIDID